MTREDSPVAEAVRDLSSRIASEMGLEIVGVDFHRGGGARWLLRLEIDRPGALGVGIEDCRRLSLAVGAALDEGDLIEHSYTLEVSSPGIDRPIRTQDDFRRNTGRRVIVETAASGGGRHAFRGVLLELEGEDCRLRDSDGAEVRVPFRDVLAARQDPAF